MVTLINQFFSKISQSIQSLPKEELCSVHASLILGKIFPQGRELSWKGHKQLNDSIACPCCWFINHIINEKLFNHSWHSFFASNPMPICLSLHHYHQSTDSLQCFIFHLNKIVYCPDYYHVTCAMSQIPSRKTLIIALIQIIAS